MALLEELVEEVLVRFPPSNPASLVRAALVCKQWRRIVASAGFRRRFCEQQRVPPTLGVLCHSREVEHCVVVRFVPTSPCLRASCHDGFAMDARHGRILLFNVSGMDCPRTCYPPTGHLCEIWLRVWDPFTGDLRELPKLQRLRLFGWSAAVLCAAHGVCDHIDCHGGAFLVVAVYYGRDKMIHVRIYSSETGSWSDEAAYAAQYPVDFRPLTRPAALLGSALHFLVTDVSKRILKYELTTRNMSMIELPSDFNVDCAVLTTEGDGELGVAGLKDSILYLWVMVMETEPETEVWWAQIGVIQLQTMLPVNVTLSHECVAFAHGDGIFFVGTNEGLFSVDLKAYKAEKVCDGAFGRYDIYSFIPYLSFYTPALRMASTGDGPNGGASSA